MGETFPIGQWGEFAARAPEKWDRAIRSGLRAAGERIAAAAKAEVPVDLGALRASITVESIEREGPRYILKISAGGAASAYAFYVHEGTGPAVGHGQYFPPPDLIEEWAVRHGFPPGSGFIVARAIGRHGTKARKYLEKPMMELGPIVVPDELERAMRAQFG